MKVYKEPTKWVKRNYWFFCPHCGYPSSGMEGSEFRKIRDVKINRRDQSIYETKCKHCHTAVRVIDPWLVSGQEYV